MASSVDKRRAVAALAADRNKQGAAGRLVKRAAIGGLLLLLVGMPVLWACGVFSGPQAVAEIEQAVDQQVAEYERVARGEVPFASAPSARSMFEKMRDVPPQYREQVGQQMGRLWEARERAEMASYFALPPERRQAELDRRIKAEDDRRKAWQAEREKRNQERAPNGQQADNGGGRGGRGGPGGPGGGGPGGGPGGGGGPPGGGRRGGGTEEARNERSKRRIDQSSPEQRAQQAEYRRAMEERRTQLGLPSGGRRGG